MHFVTERCVFELRENGLYLTEIAKGIDLQKDIIQQMEFVPNIAEDIKEIPDILYRQGAFGLRDLMQKRR